MYYINSFFVYSLLGFIIESTIFKNTKLKASGVLKGPITIVYGIGALILLLTNRYIIDKIKLKEPLKITITFIIYIITLTLVELICGYLCNLIFNVDMWNYTDKKYNIGKYICLEYIGIWGIYGIITTYILKPFIDKIIKLIPKEITYLLLFITTLDFIITIITK